MLSHVLVVIILCYVRQIICLPYVLYHNRPPPRKGKSTIGDSLQISLEQINTIATFNPRTLLGQTDLQGILYSSEEDVVSHTLDPQKANDQLIDMCNDSSTTTVRQNKHVSMRHQADTSPHYPTGPSTLL